MSDASEALTGARQLGPASTWEKTPAQLAAEYNPNAKGQFARTSIERAAYALSQRYVSRSEFRDSDNQIDNLGGLVANVDGRMHELWTIYLAVELNYAPAIAVLQKRADAGSALAKAALGRVVSA